MKLKSLLFITCFTTIFCFVGCGKKDEEVASDPANLDRNVTISSKEDSYSVLDPEFAFEEFLWEKEKEEFQVNSLKLTAEWDKSIMVGDTAISSTSPTDISLLPNYFYGDNSDHTNLENAYHDSYYAIAAQTGRIKIGNQSSFNFQVESTSYGDNLIVESIQLTGITNILEDAGAELKSMSSYINGTFGIGSTYSYVIGINGEPTGIVTDKSGDFNITTVVYSGENAEMTLLFSWAKDGDVNNAVLTSIYWKPSVVCSLLHNQENISEFIGIPEGNETITKE